MCKAILASTVLILGGCSTTADGPTSPDARIQTAESFIDAFYSFEPARLTPLLADAPDSAQDLLYYQGWAEGGNYRVLDRQRCRSSGADTVRCDIIVRDDLIGALKTGFDVTDSFHFTFENMSIVKVSNTSNDPPEFDEALKWLKTTRPAMWEGPCKDFYAGGLTPGDCVRAIVAGFADWRTTR